MRRPGAVRRSFLFICVGAVANIPSTILKKYDGRFKDVFEEVYES